MHLWKMKKKKNFKNFFCFLKQAMEYPILSFNQIFSFQTDLGVIWVEQFNLNLIAISPFIEITKEYVF